MHHACGQVCCLINLVLIHIGWGRYRVDRVCGSENILKRSDCRLMLNVLDLFLTYCEHIVLLSAFWHRLQDYLAKQASFNFLGRRQTPATQQSNPSKRCCSWCSGMTFCCISFAVSLLMSRRTAATGQHCYVGVALDKKRDKTQCCWDSNTECRRYPAYFLMRKH